MTSQAETTAAVLPTPELSVSIADALERARSTWLDAATDRLLNAYASRNRIARWHAREGKAMLPELYTMEQEAEARAKKIDRAWTDFFNSVAHAGLPVDPERFTCAGTFVLDAHEREPAVSDLLADLPGRLAAHNKAAAATAKAITDIPYLANKVAEFEAAAPRSLRRDFLLSALMGDMQDLGIEPTPELLEEAGIARRDVAGHWDAACSMLHKHRNARMEGRTDA